MERHPCHPPQKTELHMPDRRSEAMRQAYARLNAHEFLLEIAMSQLWAHAPREDNEAARKNILRLMRQAYVSSGGDVDYSDETMALLFDSQEIIRRFLDKVVERSADIREATAHLP